MRPRHQNGSIVKRDGLWLIRYYEDRVEQGKAEACPRIQNSGAGQQHL